MAFLLTFLLTATALADTPLFVVSGGFRSCRGAGPREMHLRRDFECYVKDAWPDSAPEVIYSCFDGNTDPKKAELKFTSERAIVTGPADSTTDALAEQIRKRANGRPVIFLGHSHGGWLASKLALSLAGAVGVKGLVTFDPISRVTCPSSELTKVLTWVDQSTAALKAGRFPPAPPRPARGCLEFPRDLEEKDLAKIGAIALNLYQTKDSWLHSGPTEALPSTLIPSPTIPGARRAEDSPGWRALSGHASLCHDPRPWRRVRSALEEELGIKLATCRFD